MKNKRLLSLLAIMLMTSLIIVGCGGGKEEPVKEAEEPTEDVEETEPVAEGENQIIVGNSSELSGDWSAPYFQNNASDRDITRFINGYSTVDITFEGEYVVDETIVSSYEEVNNEDGSLTATYKIIDGLEFNDGTPITAKNYVAHGLLWSSNVVGEMKGNNTLGQKWVGYGDFASGESQVFKGLRLIDDNTFSVTIAAEELPYYYILAETSLQPLDIAFWTDETVEVKDDGEGAYFSDNFTLENFEDRITAARREVPRPSSGAYKLVDFNESTKVAILEINEKYQGNFEGQKPSIETIIYKKINDETAFDELTTGQVDILTQMASGAEINKGLDLVEGGGYDYLEYPRAGYGKLVFACDFGPAQFVEVRQAIAHLLDRNDFAKAFTGGYGTVVNGPYGEALWFYQETKDELNEKLNPYTYNLDKAIEVLEEGGWVLNADGGEYTDGIRHKEVEGEIMPLVIEWASTEDNEVSDLLVINLQENPDLKKAGIEINQTTMTFPELLNYYYREGEDAKYEVPTYNMFNLASNFTPVYDRKNEYTIDPVLVKQGLNNNYILDEDLAFLAKDIAMTDSEDREEFKSKFVDFIVKWNELLPDLPLYSNIYHDFYNEKLENYDTNALLDIPRALLYSNVAGFDGPAE